MTTLGLVLILVGFLIVVTRGPLIFAPVATRDLYLSLFDTNAKMRVVGWVGAAMGVLLMVGGQGNPESIATVLFYLGAFIALLALIAIMPFPGAMRNVATNVWSAFSVGFLRGIGLVSTLLGIVLILYGLSL